MCSHGIWHTYMAYCNNMFVMCPSVSFRAQSNGKKHQNYLITMIFSIFFHRFPPFPAWSSTLLFFSPFRSSRESLHVQDDDARVERAQRERLAEERRGETQKDRPVWSIVISKLCDSFRNIYLSVKISKHKERLSLSQNFWANFSNLPYIILLKLLKSIPTVKSIWKSEM